VPKVVKGFTTYVDTNEFLAERIRQLSPDTNPFDDDDFKKRYDLVFGKISSYSNGGATYYSCDNLTAWSDQELASEGKCPAFCRVLPYPSDDASCREHEYWCEKLRVASNGACFNKLFYDPNDDRTKSIIEDVNFQKQTVPVLNYSGGIVDVEQKHPLTAAVENKCGYLVPQKVPPNIKMISYSSSDGTSGSWGGDPFCEKLVTPGENFNTEDIDPEKLKKCLEAGAQQATTTGTRHTGKFCPTIYRTVTYDPNTGQFTKPGSGFGDCDGFYSGAVNINLGKLNAMFSCNSQDLKCIADNAYYATKDLGTYVIINGDCNKIAAVPSEALWLPPTVDCSKCMKIGFTQIQASLKASRQEIQQIANLYIKIMLCPIIALALTGVILPGLSNFLGGELFIPALDKIL